MVAGFFADFFMDFIDGEAYVTDVPQRFFHRMVMGLRK